MSTPPRDDRSRRQKRTTQTEYGHNPEFRVTLETRARWLGPLREDHIHITRPDPRIKQHPFNAIGRLVVHEECAAHGSFCEVTPRPGLTKRQTVDLLEYARKMFRNRTRDDSRKWLTISASAGLYGLCVFDWSSAWPWA